MILKLYYVIAFTTIFSKFECRYEIPYHLLGGTAKELYGNGEFEFDEVSADVLVSYQKLNSLK